MKKVITLPLHLAVFILSNSKRKLNNFIHSIDGFNTNNVFYSDIDKLYIESKHWENSNEDGLVGKKLLQGKNDYKDGANLYELFLAPK